MKRLFLAGLVALAFHAFLLCVGEVAWDDKPYIGKPKPRLVTLNLRDFSPELPKITPSEAPSQEETAPSREPPAPLPPPEPRPKEKKAIKTPVQQSEIPKKKAAPDESPKPDKKEMTEEASLSIKEPGGTGETSMAPSPITEKQGPADPQDHPRGVFSTSTPGRVVLARPSYRENPTPEYPALARRKGYEGMVVLEVLVDVQGGVKDLRVSDSSGYSVLDQAALASVKRWLFEPGMKGDDKVEMWVRIPIRFQLK